MQCIQAVIASDAVRWSVPNHLEAAGGASKATIQRAAGNRLAIKSEGRILFLDLSEILWIKAEGNYVLLHCRERAHMLRGTLRGVEDALAELDFIRIHRSAIVNSVHIRELKALPSGEYCIRLRDGKELLVTRKFKRNLSRIAALPIGVDLQTL